MEFGSSTTTISFQSDIDDVAVITKVIIFVLLKQEPVLKMGWYGTIVVCIVPHAFSLLSFGAFVWGPSPVLFLSSSPSHEFEGTGGF